MLKREKNNIWKNEWKNMEGKRMKQKTWRMKEEQVRHASFLESQLWIYLDTENEERMLYIIKYRNQLLRNRRRNK